MELSMEFSVVHSNRFQ